MDTKKYFILIIFVLMGLLIACEKKQSYRNYQEIKTNPIILEKLLKGKLSDSKEHSHVEWTPPENWKELKATGFRKGVYQTKEGLTCTIISFPKDAGGIKANIIRWLGQINIQITPTEIDSYVSSLKTHRNSSNISYTLVDINQLIKEKKINNSQTILGAVFNFDHETYFFKIQGDITKVEKEKSNFIQLCDSVTLHSDSH